MIKPEDDSRSTDSGMRLKSCDTVEFGGLLGYAPVMPVNSFDCTEFIEGGGRIPAPIHSFKKLIV